MHCSGKMLVINYGAFKTIVMPDKKAINRSNVKEMLDRKTLQQLYNKQQTGNSCILIKL